VQTPQGSGPFCCLLGNILKFSWQKEVVIFVKKMNFPEHLKSFITISDMNLTYMYQYIYLHLNLWFLLIQ